MGDLDYEYEITTNSPVGKRTWLKLYGGLLHMWHAEDLSQTSVQANCLFLNSANALPLKAKQKNIHFVRSGSSTELSNLTVLAI